MEENSLLEWMPGAGDTTSRLSTIDPSMMEITNCAFIGSNVTKIVIPAHVKVIGEGAFRDCVYLRHVEFHEGLEYIGKEAFRQCTSLKSIVIPRTVKTMDDRAFRDCTSLERIDLPPGLEKLGNQVFRNCTALKRIEVPYTVKAIGENAFRGCVKLTEVKLSDGLRKISNDAFCRCSSLERIQLPSTVHSVHKRAFSKCPKLLRVKFSKEIVDLVCYPKTMPRDWWNEGVPKHALRTYTFVAESNLPKRLGKLRVMKWRIHVETMMKGIPSVSSNQLDPYLTSIVHKLAVFERLQKISPLLELAIWKSKLVEECAPDCILYLSAEMKAMHRVNCGASVIIPNVLPFLLHDRLPRWTPLASGP